MALSKPERINKIGSSDNAFLSISEAKIRHFCEVSYSSALSVDVIHHLLGCENLDNFTMELEDSFQCFDFCCSDLLKTVQEEKKEILFFEDRKDYSSSIIIIVTKQLKTKSKREHVIFNAVVRLTIMVEPKVGYARYFKFTGQLISLNIQFPIKYFVTY